MVQFSQFYNDRSTSDIMFRLALGLMMLATTSSEICGQLQGNCHVSIPVPTIISFSPSRVGGKGGMGDGVGWGSESG